jgi:hypothetical protein
MYLSNMPSDIDLDIDLTGYQQLVLDRISHGFNLCATGISGLERVRK